MDASLNTGATTREQGVNEAQSGEKGVLGTIADLSLAAAGFFFATGLATGGSFQDGLLAELKEHFAQNPGKTYVTYRGAYYGPVMDVASGKKDIWKFSTLGELQEAQKKAANEYSLAKGLAIELGGGRYAIMNRGVRLEVSDQELASILLSRQVEDGTPRDQARYQIGSKIFAYGAVGIEEISDRIAAGQLSGREGECTRVGRTYYYQKDGKVHGPYNSRLEAQYFLGDGTTIENVLQDQLGRGISVQDTHFVGQDGLHYGLRKEGSECQMRGFPLEVQLNIWKGKRSLRDSLYDQVVMEERHPNNTYIEYPLGTHNGMVEKGRNSETGAIQSTGIEHRGTYKEFNQLRAIKAFEIKGENAPWTAVEVMNEWYVCYLKKENEKKQITGPFASQTEAEQCIAGKKQERERFIAAKKKEEEEIKKAEEQVKWIKEKGSVVIGGIGSFVSSFWDLGKSSSPAAASTPLAAPSSSLTLPRQEATSGVSKLPSASTASRKETQVSLRKKPSTISSVPARVPDSYDQTAKPAPAALSQAATPFAEPAAPRKQVQVSSQQMLPRADRDEFSSELLPQESGVSSFKLPTVADEEEFRPAQGFSASASLPDSYNPRITSVATDSAWGFHPESSVPSFASTHSVQELPINQSFVYHSPQVSVEASAGFVPFVPSQQAPVYNGFIPAASVPPSAPLSGFTPSAQPQQSAPVSGFIPAATQPTQQQQSAFTGVYNPYGRTFGGKS